MSSAGMVVLEALGDGSDETARIQAAVSAGDVELRGTFSMSTLGVRFPGGELREVDATRAQFVVRDDARERLGKLFYTGPQALVTWRGGDFSCTQIWPAGVDWRIAWYVDEATALIEGARFGGFTDAVCVGGNRPSEGVVLSGLAIHYSRRNGLSLTCARKVSVERCTIRDTRLNADPGAGVHVEPNAGARVEDVTVVNCVVENCEKGIYMQPGKGLPGRNYTVVGCRLLGNRQFGMIVNGAQGLTVSDCFIQGSPIGVSIGGHTAAARAKEVAFVGNDVAECPTPLRFPGVDGLFCLWNDLHGGQPTYPALGVIGDLTVRQ